MNNIRDFFKRNEWEISHSFKTPGRQGRYRDHASLKLSSASNQVLASFSNGLYENQWSAIDEFSKGANICVSTSTSSGKTLIFHICAIELLCKNPNAKVLAIYPLKALGTEQEKRWKDIISKSGLPCKVGRIDGGVEQNARNKIIRESNIIIATPDIIHAWLLSNVSNKPVTKFLKNLSLLVIDEAHTYSGVFGSNSAFLFRRLQHLVSLTGGSYQSIAASATIKTPEVHLKMLTGNDFSIIDDSHETSPKRETEILLVSTPKSRELLTPLSNLMRFLSKETSYQFITFVDSRKQTEYIAAISSRTSGNDVSSDDDKIDTSITKNLPICPYRSGYEEEDRSKIQNALSKGELRGVISTSALKMGIDLPHLNLGILIGVPSSSTSFYQRIGRIGRHTNGIIIIVNNGSIQTEAIFRDPERLMRIPLSESTLYLDNPRIQYIHTLCLARQGGEDETLRTALGMDSDELTPHSTFPDSFVQLCKSEQIGEIPTEFQTMKAQAGDDPHHTYPLRNIDIQYKVELRNGPYLKNLGSLGFSQVMREAYPGAVYYYGAKTFRVFRLNNHKRLIEVRREKQYTTKPTMLPTLIFPNMSNGNIIQSKQFGKLTIVECNLQIRESISSFTETRGPNELNITYPLDPSQGIYFDMQRFTRNYFTSGVIINHPLLNQNVKCPLLSEILYEAFFMVIPFERQDIHYGSDKHRAERNNFEKDSKFLSIFDQTYGSLRLTSKFLENDVIMKIFSNAIDIAENDTRFIDNQQEIEVLRSLKEELSAPEENLTITSEESFLDTDDCARVILPNSVGLDTRNERNEEFFIDEVFYSPRFGLSYKGRRLSETTKRLTTDTLLANAPITIAPTSAIQEIPGESSIGLYDYNTGDIRDFNGVI